MSARRTAQIGVALVAAAGALVAVPAQAASCVTYDVSSNNRAVVVRNTCDDSRRIKVIWNNATDSACQQLAARTGEFIDSRGWPAAFDRWEYC